MDKRLTVKRLDIVMILLALGLTGLSAFAAYVRPANAVRVVINGQDGEWVFPLDANERVTVSGPLGNTIVRIEGNEAWVESSPCANQVCVAAGHIHVQGSWVACLPNSVFLIIEGKEVRRHVPDSTSW